MTDGIIQKVISSRKQRFINNNNLGMGYMELIDTFNSLEKELIEEIEKQYKYWNIDSARDSEVLRKLIGDSK